MMTVASNKWWNEYGYDLWNYVVDYLFDYDDNFDGVPCDEIVEEVLDKVGKTIEYNTDTSIDEMISIIDAVIDDMM